MHSIDLPDGRSLEMRSYVPRAPAGSSTVPEPARPTVVLNGGMMWIGLGFLGWISWSFNREFGFAFARNDMSCVVLLSPGRHIMHTWIAEFVLVCLLMPFICFSAIPQLIWMFILILVLGSVWMDSILFLPLAGLLHLLDAGLLSVPTIWALIRVSQKLRGQLECAPADPLVDMQAAVAWTQAQKELLGSDGRLVVAGYSSGGHVAAHYLLSKCPKPIFEVSVLISALLALRLEDEADGEGKQSGVLRRLTQLPRDFVRLFFKQCMTQGQGFQPGWRGLCPIATACAGNARWPAKRCLVTNAENELCGFPGEKLLFGSTGAFCDALTKHRGVAEMQYKACGRNHWHMIMCLDKVLRPLRESLDAASAANTSEPVARSQHGG